MIRNTTSHFDAAREQLDELLWLAEQFLYTLDIDQPECYPDDERLSLRILADFLMVNHLFLFDPKSLRPDLKELLQQPNTAQLHPQARLAPRGNQPKTSICPD